MTLTIRGLEPADMEQAWANNVVAFGNAPADKAGWLAGFPPEDGVGAFDGDRMVAKARARRFRQWWGGRSVQMAGIASVTVAPDRRGQGLARAVMRNALEIAHARGDAVSMLYPASVPLYRSLGFELAGDHTWLRLPTSALRSRAAVPTSAVRPAVAGDLDAIVAAHRVVAAEAPGSIDRDSARWGWRLGIGSPDSEVYVEESGGAVSAVVAYRREPGPDGATAGAVRVGDVFAVDGHGWNRMLALVGSSSTVTSSVVLNARRADLEHHVAEAAPAVDEHHTWMLRLLDAEAAVAARGFPAGVTAEVHLELVDDDLPHNAGRWRLQVAEGRGRLERGGDGRVRLGPRGLASLYAGRLHPTSLHRLGLLETRSASAYAGLAAVFAAPPAHSWDYF